MGLLLGDQDFMDLHLSPMYVLKKVFRAGVLATNTRPTGKNREKPIDGYFILQILSAVWILVVRCTTRTPTADNTCKMKHVSRSFTLFAQRSRECC